MNLFKIHKRGSINIGKAIPKTKIKSLKLSVENIIVANIAPRKVLPTSPRKTFAGDQLKNKKLIIELEIIKRGKFKEIESDIKIMKKQSLTIPSIPSIKFVKFTIAVNVITQIIQMRIFNKNYS